MSKLFFEMTEAEVQLQNILNNLEYAHYQVAAGINGYGNGIMTEEECEETESSVTSALEVAMNGVKKLIGEHSGRRGRTAARNGNGRNHADQCRKRGSVRSDAESLPAWNGESKGREDCRISSIWIRGHGRVKTVCFD